MFHDFITRYTDIFLKKWEKLQKFLTSFQQKTLAYFNILMFKILMKRQLTMSLVLNNRVLIRLDILDCFKWEKTNQTNTVLLLFNLLGSSLCLFLPFTKDSWRTSYNLWACNIMRIISLYIHVYWNKNTFLLLWSKIRKLHIKFHAY